MEKREGFFFIQIAEEMNKFVFPFYEKNIFFILKKSGFKAHSSGTTASK